MDQELLGKLLIASPGLEDAAGWTTVNAIDAGAANTFAGRRLSAKKTGITLEICRNIL